MKKIIIVGDDWPGSNVLFLVRAFERMGVAIVFIAQNQILPIYKNKFLRGVRRILTPLFIQELQNRILTVSLQWRPDFVLVAGGHYVTKKTLITLRANQIRTMCLYFDVRIQVADSLFFNNIPHYDVIGSMRAWHKELFEQLGAKHFICVRFGYSKEYHFPLENTFNISKKNNDIVFIGTHEIPRNHYLRHLVRHLPENAQLRIYGNLWQRELDEKLRASITGFSIDHPALMREIYSQCRMAVHFVGWDPHSSDPMMQKGDAHNSRSFQIPACGAMMLAQHTHEHDRFFVQNQEYVSFTTPEQLVENVHTYWHQPEKCLAIAKNGYERVIKSDYSYEPVAKQLLESINRIHLN